MDVFVTGATGVLGRGAVSRLVAAGHEVRGLARSDANADMLERMGAVPVAADLFDLESLVTAAKGTDAVLHLATKIPPYSKARRKRSWAENDRIRTEGTANLAEAAQRADVDRFVAESIAFVYHDGGAGWIDESEPIDTSWQTSTADLERAVAGFDTAGGTGIVLRFGFFLGPEAASTRDQIRLARRGLAPMIGPRDAYLPSIHTDDAADAVVAALDTPGGTYNVVDDDPATRREYAEAVFAALGLDSRPRFVPRWLARLAVGPGAAAMSGSWRVSNTKFRESSGWQPRFDVATGWVDVVDRIDE